MAETETLNLRVASDYNRRLVVEAFKEKRSVTNYLEVSLTDLWHHRSLRAQSNVGKPTKKPISTRARNESSNV